MATCGRCGRSWGELPDEQGDHPCPRCGRGPGEDNERPAKHFGEHDAAGKAGSPNRETTMRLYEIGDALAAALARAEAEDGDLTDEDADALDALEGALEDKIEGCAKAVRNYAAEADALKAEAKRLADRAKTADRNADRVKTYLAEQMGRVGVKQVKGAVLTVALHDSPPSVTQADVAVLAPEYVRVIPEERQADKKAIIAHFRETGEAPSGAHIEHNRYVVIR